MSNMYKIHNGDAGLVRFHRFGPALLIAASLLLPSIQARHINSIATALAYLEGLCIRDGTWGRYVLEAEESFILRFRNYVLEDFASDDLTVMNLLTSIHVSIQSFSGKPLETVLGSMRRTWQPAAPPSYGILAPYFSATESMFEMLTRVSTPSTHALELASQRGGARGFMQLHTGVTDDKFPEWDHHEYSQWYCSEDAPYLKLYDRGCCYKRARFTPAEPDLGKWPTCRQLFDTMPVNPYVRCRRTTPSKWHIPSPRSNWVPGLVPLFRVPSADKIGGGSKMDDELVLSSSLSKQTTSLFQMPSAVLALSRLTANGAFAYEAGVTECASWSPSVSPRTSYSVGQFIRRRGYAALPFYLPASDGIVSINLAFRGKVIAAFLELHDSFWAPVPVVDNAIDFFLPRRDHYLLVVLFGTPAGTYADTLDFLAELCAQQIVSKL